MLIKPVSRLFPRTRITNAIRFLSGFLFQERKMEIETCHHLFPNGRESPGLKFELTYIDQETKIDLEIKSKPVVLMLPGAPGSFLDFKAQVPVLVDHGARVISVNFPGLPALLKYKSPKCRNTPENKESMVRDFLDSLGISKIDMLVTHSSAVYTGLRLFCNQRELDITSYALVNPLGHWHTTTRPAWFFIPLGEMINYRLGYAFLKIMGMYFLPYVSPVSVPNIDAPLLGLAAIRSFRMKEAKENLLKLAAEKKPSLLLFSDNDRLIQKRVSHEVLQILGSKREDWWLYDDQGCLQLKGREDGWLRVINFAAGSHYSMRKHPDVVSQALVKHLQRTLELQGLAPSSHVVAEIESKRSSITTKLTSMNIN